MQMAILRRRQTFMGTTTDTTSVQLRPALDYFVAHNISLGGQLRIEYAAGDNSVNTTITTIGLVPRIGYDLALSPTSSIWPRVGLGYIHTSYDNGGSGAYNFSSYTVTLDVFVPLLFQPVPHFFLGGGPFLTTDLVSKLEGADTIKTTNIGLMSTIGGYFGPQIGRRPGGSSASTAAADSAAAVPGYIVIVRGRRPVPTGVRT